MIKALTKIILAVALALAPAVEQSWAFSVVTKARAIAPAVEFHGCQSDTSNATTYTFSNVDLGAPAADRIVWAIALGEDDATSFAISSGTIGGFTASVATSDSAAAVTMGNGTLALFGHSNGDGQVSVTWNEAITGMTLCVFVTYGDYLLADQQAPIAFAIEDTDDPTGTSGAALVMSNLNAMKAEHRIVLGACASAGTGDTTTWSNMTELVDTNNGEFNYSTAVADDETRTGAAAAVTWTCDWTGTSNVTSIFIVLRQRNEGPRGRYVFDGCTADTSNATTYTYTNHSIGAAPAGADLNRYVIVIALGEDSATVFNVASATIGGTATDFLTSGTGTQLVTAAVMGREVNSGTTATIAVTWSEAITSSVVCVWSAYNIALQGTSIIGNANSSNSSNLDLSIAGGPNFSALVFGACTNTGVADSATWAGLTEDADTQHAEADYSAASLMTLTYQSSLTIGCDWTGTNAAAGARLRIYGW